MAGLHARLGELLKSMHMITDDTLMNALDEQKRLAAWPFRISRPGLPDLIRKGGPSDGLKYKLLGEILVHKGALLTDHLRTALLEQCRLATPPCELLGKEDMEAIIKLLGFINSTINLDELLDRIMVAAREVLYAEASSLMLIEEQTGDLIVSVPTGPRRKELKEVRIPRGQGVAGWVAQEEKALVVPDATKDPRFFERLDKLSGFVTKSLVCVPLKAKGKVLGVIEVINRSDGRPFEEQDAELLSTFAHQAAVVLDNARLQAEALEYYSLRHELNIAKRIQERFIPVAGPSAEGVEYAGWISPAEAVSGDFYDFMKTPEEELLIFIGDVVGKGIPASLLMATTRSALRILLTRERDLSAVLDTMNRFLVREQDNQEFVTLFLARYSSRTKSLRFVNCGHTPPLLITSEGSEQLDTGGRPLGAFPDEEYPFVDRSLLPGDILVLCTDGLTELRNKQGDFFGESRLESICRAVRNKSAPDILEDIKKAASSFADGMLQGDDISVVVLKAL
jgi:sigma-B regulation protein RsbU (phosphoserine phosphatase)